MDSSTPASSHSLRAHYRDSQAIASRLRLLNNVGRLLAEDSGEASLLTALKHCLEFAAFEAGALLLDSGGALLVKASKGEVLPQGARLAAKGAFSAVLKPQAAPIFRQNAVSRLVLTGGGLAATELLMPLKARGQVVGALAMSSRKTMDAPLPDDLEVLLTVSAMLAFAMQGPAGVNAAQAAQRTEQFLAPLTARERDVIALLPHGFTNEEIGLRLGIARGTVKVHVERIIGKLGASDRTQVAALAVEMGVLSAPAERP